MADLFKQLLKTILAESLQVNAKGELEKQKGNLVDFNKFPKDLLKQFEYNYGKYYKNKFDWNKEQDRFTDPNGKFDGEGFNNFVDNKDQTEFLKNLDKIRLAVSEDLVTLKKREISKLKLEKFEELILPVFEKDITFTPSVFLMNKLLGFYDTQTVEDIERVYREAEQVMDKEGNIDYDKVTPANEYKHVNNAEFKRFVSKNPQYKKMYDIWKKLFDEEIKDSVKDLNAFHIISLKDLKDIYMILKTFKK